MISMIISLRVLLSVLVQIGMKNVKKNNKYFLNLEKSNKKKSCVRNIVTSDGTITANPKTIMNEQESFYFFVIGSENYAISNLNRTSLVLEETIGQS